jgi:hypothetical protein
MKRLMVEKLTINLNLSLNLKMIPGEMIKSFTDMDVWKISHHLSYQVFELTGRLPKSEDYGLTSQIRRSANSVSANIAEGFGKMVSL